ncbi:bifunctional metallophosphatase/5'-nucleotidase [Longimicrobium sp.]|uniref:bifunctional metallophosphatase/5'-nucleotidase n=1 Tax=Longimicrobium sp. TaxID=2029185 RepID=UPI002C88B907|nr:5'-nucleotidase C-terminal domain-containing protein [Longimicrobium sp.]HSU13851.1 5'-nucleotidase C-terminal domain-containing protein [Longimicrobium sp.]
MPDLTSRLRGAAIIAALALAAAASSADAQRSAPAVTVLQLNDVYRIDAVENGRAGGIGRVVTLAAQARARGEEVLVLHAGDAIAPSLESRYFAGLQMIDALNYLAGVAPMVFVPGNHEFDERRPGMAAEAVKASRFPWLAGNVVFATGDTAADRRVGRDTVITTAGGLKLGIFTLTFLDSPRDWARPDSAFVQDAERMIRGLESRGADVIVGLTHLTHDTDREISRLRRTHPRFAWICGGHEHFRLSDPLTDGTALITKGESNARGIWRVTLSRQGRRGIARAEAVEVDERIAVDPGYQRQVSEAWAARLRQKVPFMDVAIGRADTLMDASEETVRNAESAWGNWLADQMRTVYPTMPADVAVLNGGAIRIDDAFGGEVRWEHLARTFGFPTRVGLVSLRGRDLRETVLERSVSGGRGEGRFLQVSGMKVRFDRSRPEGQRILDVQVQRGSSWAPLADDSVYVVAVPDYMYGGGDGYTFIQRAISRVPPGPDLKLAAFDALTAAYARGEAISPRVEGRLVDATPRGPEN